LTNKEITLTILLSMITVEFYASGFYSPRILRGLKNGTLFCIKMRKIEVKKTKKSHAHYEPDFKEEILRMLNSRKNVDENRRHLVLGVMSSADARYTWKKNLR